MANFKPPKKKQHRKIVNHGITTQKFNENAKKNEKIELVVRPAVQNVWPRLEYNIKPVERNQLDNYNTLETNPLTATVDR